MPAWVGMRMGRWRRASTRRTMELMARKGGRRAGQLAGSLPWWRWTGI